MEVRRGGRPAGRPSSFPALRRGRGRGGGTTAGCGYVCPSCVSVRGVTVHPSVHGSVASFERRGVDRLRKGRHGRKVPRRPPRSSFGFSVPSAVGSTTRPLQISPRRGGRLRRSSMLGAQPPSNRREKRRREGWGSLLLVVVAEASNRERAAATLNCRVQQHSK
jgi:hypothetical protein